MMTRPHCHSLTLVLFSSIDPKRVSVELPGCGKRIRAQNLSLENDNTGSAYAHQLFSNTPLNSSIFVRSFISAAQCKQENGDAEVRKCESPKEEEKKKIVLL